MKPFIPGKRNQNLVFQVHRLISRSIPLIINIASATALFLSTLIVETSSNFETFSFVFFLSSFGNLIGYKLGSKSTVNTDSKSQKVLFTLLSVALLTGALIYILAEGDLAIYGTFGILFLFGLAGVVYVLRS